MMRKIVLIVLLVSSFGAFAQNQDVKGNRVIANTSVFLKDWWITDFQRDTALSSDSKLPTAKSVRDFLLGRLAGFTPGGGTAFDSTYVYYVLSTKASQSALNDTAAALRALIASIPPGGGSADSATFFTKYRSDTMRAHIWAAIQKNVDSITAHNIRIGAKANQSALVDTAAALRALANLKATIVALNDSAAALRAQIALQDTFLLGYMLTKDSSAGKVRMKVDSLKLDSLLTARSVGGGLIDTSSFSHYKPPYKVKWRGIPNIEGHSIAAGNSASSTANSYSGIVAATTKTTANNTAVASSSVRNGIFRQFSNGTTIRFDQPLLLDIIINDINNSSSIYKFNCIIEGHKTMIVNRWLGDFMPSDSAAITKTGSWPSLSTSNISSKTVISGRGTPIKTSVLGNKLNFVWQGNNIVIGTWGVDGSHTGYGSFAVYIDGVLYATYDMKGKATDWFYAPLGTFDERMPTVVLIRGLTSGKHSVEIRALENKEIDIDYIGSIVEPANAPSIIVCDALKAKSTGYSPAGFASDIDTINRKIDSLVNTFINRGDNIAEAKTNNHFDTANTVGPLHPDDLGHAQVAKDILAVIDTFPVTSTGALTFGAGLLGGSYNGATNITARADTGRGNSQVTTGYDLNKVKDSLAATVSSKISGLTAAISTNSIDNLNYRQKWFWSTLAGDTALVINSTSTAAASNAQVNIASTMTGANSTSTQTTKAGVFSNTKTGTSSTNVGIFATASGGSNNYAIIVPNGGGNVGLGTSTPAYPLDVFGAMRAYNPGGVGYWIANGSAIRGEGTGSGTNWYIDGNANGAEGTISMRATNFSVNATITGNQTWATAGSVNAGTSGAASFAGAGFMVNGYLMLGQNTDSTIATFNNNTKFSRVAMKGNNYYIYDGVAALASQTINSSAILDLQSTTRGLLIPRLTTIEKNAISSPATALSVYDTNLKTETWYNGAAWVYASAVSNGTAAPATTPAKVGDVYIDTTNKKIYFATGTSSSADWTITN